MKPGEILKNLAEVNAPQDLTELPEEITIAPLSQLTTSDPHHEGFETDEHIEIGNDAFKQFLETLPDEMAEEVKAALQITIEKDDVLKLSVTDGLTLSAGEIVGLAGDFLGVPKKPISFGKDPDAKEARFLEAYETLIDPNNYDEIDEILAYVKAQPKDPATEDTLVFQKLKDSAIVRNLRYAQITSASVLPGAFWHSRYPSLAANNFDHFGDEARVAFQTGYKLALDKVRFAKEKVEDPQTKRLLLKQAFIYMLFACHFLTDLYAAGHIRTPRKQILNWVAGNKDLDNTPEDLTTISAIRRGIAGMLAKKMHDEDCKKGIFVESEKTHKKWPAFGDGVYAKEENEKNAKKVCKAVLKVLSDIIHVYNGKSPEFDLSLAGDIPKADEETNKNCNLLPLYKVENNQLMVRTENNNYKHMKATSALRLFFSVKIKDSRQNEIELNDDSLEQLITKIEVTEKTEEAQPQEEVQNKAHANMCRIM